MNKAIIENGVVTNVIELPDDWTGANGEWQAPDGVLLIDGDGVEVGSTWDGVNIIPVAYPEPINYSQVQLDALAEITRLEASISERRKREALLGNAEAIAFIQGVEDDIAIERAKL
jgi:hypothetical protein